MASVQTFLAGDTLLLLGNEQYVRRMGSFGYDWNRLQVIVRGAPYASGAFTFSFAIALTVNGKGYFANDSDCAGCYWNQAVSVSGSPPTFTWNWGGGNTYVFTRINNVAADTSVGNNGTRTASVYPVFNAWGLDIERSGTSLIISHIDIGTISGASTALSVPRSQINYDMQPYYSNATKTCFGVESPATIAYTGSGLLDSILVRNGSAAAPFCITDIFVVRAY